MVDPVGTIIRYYGPAKYISILLIMYNNNDNNNTIVSTFRIVNRPLLDDIFDRILLQEKKIKTIHVHYKFILTSR